MTWKSKIMPDDAPELAGSLVGSMLQGQQQEITGDGRGESLPLIHEPLVMQVARAIRAERDFNDDPANWVMEGRAAIEQVAAWLLRGDAGAGSSWAEVALVLATALEVEPGPH